MNTLRSVGSASQARAIDDRMREVYGIDGARLMDAAGTAAALRIREFHPDPVPIHVLAGPGHNGGDGWVIARMLSQCGYPTTVHARSAIHPWQTDAVLALADAIRVESDFSGVEPDAILVDALFGIGLNRPVDAHHAGWIRTMNTSGRTIWSVDLPSGLDATDGILHGIAVQATHTLAIGLYKSGYWTGEGADHCGRIHLIPIGFPARELDRTSTSVFFSDDEPDVRLRPGNHKYQQGTVHVVGGSAGMSGAVVLAASAAWETGIGAVTAHVPGGLSGAVEGLLVHPTKVGYGTAEDTRFTPSHVTELVDRIMAKPGSVVIGPGLGRHPETIEFTRHLLERLTLPLVVDADALTALPDRLPAVSVLTPHPGELKTMAGSDVIRWSQRHEAAKQLALRTGAMVVSKGQPSAIITPDGRTRIAGYDTRPFSRMGAGDMLAGHIGAFLTAAPSADAIESAMIFGARTRHP